DFSPQRVYRLAHPLHHGDEAEGADVRLAHVENFRRRASFHELREHLASEVARILDLAVELAVGKGPGATFAELDVGFRIEHRLAPEAPGVPGALAHRLAA